MWLECAVEETDDRGRKTRTTEARDDRRGIPQGSPMAPRTQKITLRSRQCSVRTAGCRAVARCHGQRDAVPDDYLVVAYEVFLDEKPQDALAFQYVEGPRRRPQSRKERGQRFSEAQVGCAVD